MAGLIEIILEEAKRLGRWKWIVISVLIIGIVFFAIFSQLPDSTKEKFVHSLIGGEKATEAASFPGIEIISKDVEVDLTEWTSGSQEKDGKAVYRTIYEIRKVREDTKYFGPWVWHFLEKSKA